MFGALGQEIRVRLLADRFLRYGARGLVVVVVFVVEIVVSESRIVGAGSCAARDGADALARAHKYTGRALSDRDAVEPVHAAHHDADRRR